MTLLSLYLRIPSLRTKYEYSTEGFATPLLVGGRDYFATWLAGN